MSSRDTGPAWFDAAGMVAWVEGMARALCARVRLLDADGTELAAAGPVRRGEEVRLPLMVSGRRAGWVAIRPRAAVRRGGAMVELATATLAALAEAREAARDLVRTTARQWRELALLYRSAELLRGGQAPEAIAAGLLERALRALPATGAAVRWKVGEDPPEMLARGTERVLHALATWASDLPDPVAADPDELRRLGYGGPSPERGVVAAPLGDAARYGALVVVLRPGRPASAEDRKLAALLASQAALGFENVELLRSVREAERLRRELEMAAEIQRWILPEPAAHHGWLEVAAVCRPAEWVGGDAFLHLPLGDQGVLVGVADVSGHGVSAALVMNSFATGIAAASRETASPGELLAVGNELVAERVGSTGMFVTAIVALARPGGSCTVANAGHPPGLVARDGAVERLGGGGVPLGILAGERYPEEDVALGPGDRLVLYSDGLTEAADRSGTLFGVEGVARALERHRGGAAATVQALEEAACAHAGGAPRDDLTVLAIRRVR